MRDDLDIAPKLARLTAVTVCSGETIILDRVSLTVTMGGPTAVVGPNGAGKTTLLRLLMGLVDIAAGSVDAGSVSRAIVFQKPVMLRRSVAENVAFALKAAGYPTDDTSTMRLLNSVGLATLADRPARRLSGGEQQRLGIARALARRPQLLLLDEATASLDPAQSKIIEDLIVSIAHSGVKIVFATHDLGQARRLAVDVVLLVKGRIVEHAIADTFFTNPTTDVSRRFLAGDLIL
jgi:tungstate transport system ATP-binding protein